MACYPSNTTALLPLSAARVLTSSSGCLSCRLLYRLSYNSYRITTVQPPELRYNALDLFLSHKQRLGHSSASKIQELETLLRQSNGSGLAGPIIDRASEAVRQKLSGVRGSRAWTQVGLKVELD